MDTTTTITQGKPEHQSSKVGADSENGYLESEANKKRLEKLEAPFI